MLLTRYDNFLDSHAWLSWPWLAGPAGKRNQVEPPERKEVVETMDRTIQRSFLAIVIYALFSLLAIAQPDSKLIAGAGLVKIPFANVDINYAIFLVVGPLVMLGLALYLHIFLGHAGSWTNRRDWSRLPFLFCLPGFLARFAAFFVFYLLPLLVVYIFLWKSEPVFASQLDVPIAAISTVLFVFIMIRRCQYRWRPICVPFLVTGLFFSAAYGYLDMSYRMSSRYPSSQASEVSFFRKTEKMNTILPRCYLIGSECKCNNNSCDKIYSRRLDLEGADFTKVVNELDLTKVDLNLSDLRKANLQGTVLMGVNLSGADLRGANLRQSNLRGANLLGSRLENADLSMADLRESLYLIQKQLDGVKSCWMAKLPDGMKCNNTKVDL